MSRVVAAAGAILFALRVALEEARAFWATDDDLTGHVEEEAVLDDTDDGLEGFGGLLGFEAGAGQVAVGDVVMAVGEIGSAVFVLAHLGGEAFIGEALKGGLPGEGNDLDGELEDGAEGGDDLAGVDGDEECVGADLDELLAEECAAVAFDEEEGSFFDLVGSVDGEIEARGVGEVGHGDAEGEGSVVGRDGGGNGLDAEALGDAAADLVDDEGGGGSGAEADGHAIFNLGGGPLGGFLLGELLG
jgi:hypothetical protein